MSDQTLNRRLARAIKRAADVLVGSNYSVSYIQGEIFNLEAVREREIRKIRVVIDVIDQDDVRKVRSQDLPMICAKEIWCKRLNEPNFQIREIKNS